MLQLKIFANFKKQYKKNKLKLDTEFLNNCEQLGVYLKFIVFKLANVSSKYILSVHKRLLRSTINKCNKELQHVLKNLAYPKTFYLNSLVLLTFTSLKNL